MQPRLQLEELTVHALPASVGFADGKVWFFASAGESNAWKDRGAEVFAARHWQRLIVAVNVATGEVKYFVSNDWGRSLRTLVRVAFRRAPIEHLFRLVKQESGFAHFEGRNYRALMRHLTMAVVVMGFASLHATKSVESSIPAAAAARDAFPCCSVSRR